MKWRVDVVVLLSTLWLAALLSSCSGVGDATDSWVETGEDPAYPPSRYVVGIGFGDTVNAADDVARGEVAKFFEARVVSITRDEQTYDQKSEGDMVRLKESFESRTYTRVRGEAKLEGVEIAQRAVHLGTHYSLAVLDKPRLLSRWRKELTELDLTIEEALHEQTGQAPDRIRNLAKVMRLLSKRTGLAARLRVLGYNASLDPEDYRGVLPELYELLKTTYPMTVRSDSPEVESFLIEELRKYGFYVEAGDREAPSVLVTVALTTQARPMGKKVEVFYELELGCSSGGAEVARRRLSERIQHLDEKSARQKAFYEMRDRGVRPFVESIRKEFLGDDEEEQE